MNVVVVSDTHMPRGGRRLPDDVVRHLERADLILHAGDLVSASVLGELRELGPVEAVHGNMDDEELRRSLPDRLVVDAGTTRIGMVHDPGAREGRERRLAEMFPGCNAVVYGHTHIPQVTRHEGVWILNPGSPTERRRAPTRSFLVLEVSEGVVSPRLLDA